MKEWLSDNLRYILLLLALIVGVGAIALGVRLYQLNQREETPVVAETSAPVTIIHETEASTEKAQAKTEKAKDEKETEAKTEASTEAESKAAITLPSVTTAQAQTQPETQSTASQGAVTVPQTETTAQSETTAQPETAAQTTAQTEAYVAPEPVAEPVNSFDDPVTLYATAGVNIRSGANTDSEKIGSVESGNSVTVIGETSEWYQVTTDDGQHGFISKGYLTDETTYEEEYAPEPETSYSATATINHTCNMRSSADYGDNVIYSDLPAGTVVTYLGGDGWAQIQLDDGTVGYVGAQFVSVN